MSSHNKFTRRQFIKEAAIAGAAVGAAAGTGVLGATSAHAEAEPWLPTKWDFEADVVVIGYGFAAQATAIEADKAGAKVIILEKAPEKYRGGNSRVCGQGLIAPSKAIWDDYFQYLKMATTGQGFPVPDEHLHFYVEESSKNIEWFKSLGIELVPGHLRGENGQWIPFYPHFPGAAGVASEPEFYWVDPAKGAGRDWYALEEYIKTRPNIKVMYDSPAKRLVQVPMTKEILGVVVDNAGKEVFVKAKRAVANCGGGYEFNQEMIRDFQGMAVNYSMGTPFNTGETIKLSWEAGADLRNMGVRAAPVMYSIGIMPQYKSAIAVGIPSKGAYITIGANNKRFQNEQDSAFFGSTTGMQNKEKAGLDGARTGTGQVVENGVYVREKTPMPMFMIFDEAARLSGALFSGSYAVQVEGYKPTADNSQELANGWYMKADTLKELAEKIARPADPLFGRVTVEETVENWNKLAAAGKDTEFGRAVNLNAFEKGPFYAVQFFPLTLNTQGGMVRNVKSQVLDRFGNPIPRFYSAGENGDIWTILYQCMSNVGAGCFGYGRIAGQNAAQEKPWDAAT